VELNSRKNRIKTAENFKKERILEMKFKTFTYCVPDDGENKELNSFVSSHKVLNVFNV